MNQTGIFLIFCILGAALAQSTLDAYHDQVIRDALEDLRGDMATGIRGSGTVLAPFLIHNDDVNFEVGIFMYLRGYIRNALATGLDNFEVLQLSTDANARRVQYEIRLNNVETNGVYDLAGKMYDLVQIFGAGSFYVKPTEWTFSGHIDYELNDQNQFIVRDLLIKTNMRSMDSNFDGLLGGGDLGELINVMTEMSETLKEMFQDTIAGVLQEYVRF